MKICSKCKIEKPMCDFSKRSDRKIGVFSACKECCKGYVKHKIPILIDVLSTVNNEEWKVILGWEDYLISNKGRIYSNKKHNGKTGYYLNPILYKNLGYLYVRLSKQNIGKFLRIHRLVAIAFTENPKKLPQVNHIDKNKLNNCVENLEWCDNRENKTYSYNKSMTSSKYTGVVRVQNSWIAQIRINNKNMSLGTFVNEIDASSAYKDALIEFNVTNKYAV